MLLLFVVTIFLNAFLVFSVQPLVGKQLLPELGGTPAVWTTCQLFFQAALLGGYAWAHLGVRSLGPKRQAWVHLGFLALALTTLPFALEASSSPPTEGTPVPWILTRLWFLCGLPFVFLSAGAPILQSWFSRSSHSHAEDPYFLYAASNLGSILALLAYPLGFEPRLDLTQQAAAWAWGFRILAGLTFLCLVSTKFSSLDRELGSEAERSPPEKKNLPLWLGTSALASSLMLGVTTYITTDMAPMPLAWVAPLALYLLTFVLVFARRPWISPEGLARFYPKALLAVGLVAFARLKLSYWLQVGAHLGIFFLAATTCHHALAKSRPKAEDLTRYYLTMSLGGVLGGLFNSLLAPQLLDRVAEYPSFLVLALFFVPESEEPGPDPAPVTPARVWIGSFALAGLALSSGVRHVLVHLWVYLIPAMAASRLISRRKPFAWAMVGIALTSLWYIPHSFGSIAWQSRNFFGPKTVLQEEAPVQGRVLIHGGTVHGSQRFGPGEESIPRNYYHPKGPLGDAWKLFRAQAIPKPQVGLVGLGVGAIRTYGLPADHWVCFEIDPEVISIARNEALFTYLSKSPGSQTFVPGDARLTLAKRPETFDLLILDAFSSDAIPLHLMTLEAFEVYLERLAPEGLLFFHVSSRYFDFEPLLQALAERSKLGIRIRTDGDVPPEDLLAGRGPADWVVMARSEDRLQALDPAQGWRVPRKDPKLRVWTDSFSNVLALRR